MNLGDIVSVVGGELISGDPSFTVTDMADPVDATLTSVTFLFDQKYLSQVLASDAGVVITKERLDSDKAQVIVANPRSAMIHVAGLFSTRSTEPTPGPVSIHETATVSGSALLGAFVSIGKNVVIGDDVRLHSGVSIGDGCVIGDGSEIYPNAVLYDGVRLGKAVIIHSGAVIGADGFGYEPDQSGAHQAIPQIGGVQLGDAVHVGAHTTIDRGTMRDTVVGPGTKIDNHVQIGHNCRIGSHCILVSQVGITGGVSIGDYTLVAGQAGISADLGAHVTVAAQAGVTQPIADKQFVSGFPAKPHRDQLKEQAILRRIVRTYKK